MNIEKNIAELKVQIQKDKEFLWNHPEFSWEEFETQKYIVKRLREIGYENIITYEPTGIVATLEGTSPGKVIAFRCELDAVLQDDEEKEECKHLCGHDAHMSVMLALAQVLMSNRNKIKGTVKLLFQPSEEECGGAEFMIVNGALENPKVDKIFAIHMWGELKEGTIGIKPGPIMVGKDPFLIIVTGKNKNPKYSDDCSRTIYKASIIAKSVTELSRNSHFVADRAKVGICTIVGGAIGNSIYNEVRLIGNCNTYDNEVKGTVIKALQDTIENFHDDEDVTVEMTYYANCPVMTNPEKEALEIQEISKEIADEVNTDYRALSSAEDFSLYLEIIPGAMIFVGCYTDEPLPQHHPEFYVSEKSMLIGTQLFYDLAKKYVM